VQPGDRLRLPGPLDLGLAGLAARVAARLGWTTGCLCVATVADGLTEQPWYAGPSGTDLEIIAWAASYLALTDRLCAAVGLPLEPGEVTEWERVVNGCWMLRTRAGCWYANPNRDQERDMLANMALVPALAGLPANAHLGTLRACDSEIGHG
jgi:hypothetical protein